jgi:hypothetical protein
MNHDLYQTEYVEQISADKNRYIVIDIEEKKVLLLEGAWYQRAKEVRELTKDDPALPLFWQIYVNKAIENIDHAERTPRGIHIRPKR